MRYGKNWEPTEHYKNTAIAAKYDDTRFSGFFASIFNRREKYLIQRAFATFEKGAAIVDVPCGTGRLAEVLLRSGLRVTGVDISEQMLAVAKAKLDRYGGNFQTKVLDVRELPKAGVRYDGALCARVLMHFPLPEQIEFLRAVVLVSDRVVVFTQGLNTPLHRLRRRLKRLLGHQRPAAFPLTRSELRQLIEQAGLREIHRNKLFPLLSESIIIVAEPRTKET